MAKSFKGILDKAMEKAKTLDPETVDSIMKEVDELLEDSPNITKKNSSIDITRGLWRLCGNCASRKETLETLNKKLKNHLMNPYNFGDFVIRFGTYLKEL